MRLACSELFSWLEKGATVVLPNRLLAAVAYRQFTAHQLHASRVSWNRPEILSLSAWTTSEWQDARYGSRDVPVLLSPAQEHLLWKRIIAAQSPDLYDTDGAAALAARSSATVGQWELPALADAADFGSGARHFQRWLEIFRRTCSEEGWTTRSDLWKLLPAWLRSDASRQKSLVFPAVRRPPPGFQRLIEALGSKAIVQPIDPSPPKSLAPARSFTEVSDELDFAARWARAAFEDNPSHSIAVFVAGLESRRSQVDRAFYNVFYSGACRSLTDHHLRDMLGEHLAYHFSAGRPLHTHPLIAGALLLLEVASPRIPIADAGAILRSPWTAGALVEKSARSLADLHLRRHRELDVLLSDLEISSLRCPLLQERWPAVRKAISRRHERDSFSSWTAFFGNLLVALGWPGGGDLSSDEQNALEAWKNTLSQLGSLSLVSGDVPFEEARHELGRLLEAGSFEDGSLLAPIQILDATAAGGLQVDRSLIVGLGEETWPPSYSGTPFIPSSVGRKFGIPGSSRDLVRIERESLTAELFSTAPIIAASWSGRLSPLAARFVQPVSESATAWAGKSSWQSYKPAILEERTDNFGPPYLPVATARGGTGIIKSQSLCPFRAFAEYRLSSGAPEEGCLGFDGRDRGGHLHTALEFVWKNLRTQQNLKATSKADLARLIAEAALHAVRIDESSSFGKIVGQVEIERLKTVISDWLDIERSRLQPFTVETIEEEQFVELSGLKLRLRLDRMDRLPSGGLLLIDYKSGEQKQAKLECPRPQEPQLLVYAAGIGDSVEGVVFAQLKQRDVRPVGWTRDLHFRKERKKTVESLGMAWDERMEESRHEVERLAEQFKSGYAAVDPLPGACDYCAQKPFCRIHERATQTEDESD